MTIGMELSQFLIQAKLHTYASAREGADNLGEGGSYELAYILDHLCYRHRYFGFNPFIGEELIWQDERLIWGMNYYGKVTQETIPPSQVYSFLRQALHLVRADRPFRGPDYFRAGSFTYVDKSNGVLDAFTGDETIYYRDQQVYHLDYHGGRVGY
jgi:hypothetical protein